jgi:DNA transformation protein
MMQMNDLNKLPNIGKVLAQELEAAGIKSAEALKDIGSKEAFLLLKLSDSGSCYNKLCALQGAVEGIRWHHLSDETKADLKAFLASL